MKTSQLKEKDAEWIREIGLIKNIAALLTSYDVFIIKCARLLANRLLSVEKGDTILEKEVLKILEVNIPFSHLKLIMQ